MTHPQRSSREVAVCRRPGSSYCTWLRRELRRAGLVTTELDIWADPDAAAAARGLAGGDETLPTVVVGDSWLVNPSVARVLAAARQVGAPKSETTSGTSGRSLESFHAWALCRRAEKAVAR